MWLFVRTWAGQTDFCYQATVRCVVQHDVATMPADDVPGNGQSDAGAAAVTVAGGFEADKGFEDAFPVGGRDTWAVIPDGDAELVTRVGDAHLHLLSVADAVGDKVVDGPSQHGWLAGIG